MNIFEYNDYKEFVCDRVEGMPKRGRGEFQRIAVALRMQSSRVSEIFKGVMNLTPEQACTFCGYLGLRGIESQYFLTLVQLERAGTEDLRKMIRAQIVGLKAQVNELTQVLPKQKELSEPDKAIYCSSWLYAGVFLLISLPGYNNIDSISDYFKISRERARGIIDFLLSVGLCSESDGKIADGPSFVHLEPGSPLVFRHHANWRVKALERVESAGPRDYFISAPMSISAKDQKSLREALGSFVKNLADVASKNKGDRLACLNLDFFEF